MVKGHRRATTPVLPRASVSPPQNHLETRLLLAPSERAQAIAAMRRWHRFASLFASQLTAGGTLLCSAQATQAAARLVLIAGKV